MVMYGIEPWGETRADLGWATVAATVVNVNLPKGKKQAAVADFMPKFDRDPRRMSDEIRAVMGGLGAKKGRLKRPAKNGQITPQE